MTAPAELDYAPPPEIDPAESAAVWRVAWWAGLLWAIFTLTWLWRTGWDTLSGARSDSSTAWPYTPWNAITHTALALSAAAVLVSVFAAKRHRRVVAVAATLAAAMAVLRAADVIAANGGILGSGWLGWPSIFFLLVDPIRNGGGAILLAPVAWRPRLLTGGGLALVVAGLLMPGPLSGAADVLWEVQHGQTLGRFFANYAAQDLLYSYVADAVLLLAAASLVVAAGSARRRRWLFVVAAVLALDAAGGSWGWELRRNFDSNVLFDCGLLVSAAAVAGSNFVVAAPALALLAWPFRAPEPGR